MPDNRRPPEPDPGSGVSFLDRFPHDRLYPLIGGLIGLATPVGAFVLRWLEADPDLFPLWMRSELSYNSVFYLYMALGSAVSFVAFGYVLGVLSESQRVRNRDLRQRMADLHLKSVTDGLTGAFSHAFLHETLAIELERSRRQGRPLSILMMDLDNFKSLNDAHGHLFGDRVLQELTETVNMNIRQEDVLGRYGGEEFLVIMPGADHAVAERVAERVRRAVARTPIVDFRDAQRHVHTTLSIGIATRQGENSEPQAAAFLDHADRNLYEAKRLGKNRICG
ncbi:MAG: hypothetical protein A2X36_09130 [Elusimicrobia bacterium GWA2_69_24]|nr:MAG: hypothetical protein A2X36_09130 [Elusimicrobia bacterium GWA2_69_24]HBL18555.1 hypothetical protein [Elusimicrobiota bacterium]